MGPLFWACQEGCAESVQLLVDAGAWSGAERDGRVWVGGLGTAAEEGHVDVVRMLITMGVDVDGVDVDGDTPLCRASRSGRVDVVTALVDEGGADVNKAGVRGETPLICAASAGKEDVVRVLLDLASADHEIANNE